MPIETYISFYLSTFRIHIFSKTITEIGCPKFIRFLVKDEGPSIIMEPYDRKDFQSHRVSQRKKGSNGMDINSMPLCTLLKNRLGWESDHSYRVPGKVYLSQRVAVFDLSNAVRINNPL